jgi:hypothetical protein
VNVQASMTYTNKSQTNSAESQRRVSSADQSPSCRPDHSSLRDLPSADLPRKHRQSQWRQQRSSLCGDKDQARGRK